MSSPITNARLTCALHTGFGSTIGVIAFFIYREIPSDHRTLLAALTYQAVNVFIVMALIMAFVEVRRVVKGSGS